MNGILTRSVAALALAIALMVVALPASAQSSYPGNQPGSSTVEPGTTNPGQFDQTQGDRYDNRGQNRGQVDGQNNTSTGPDNMNNQNNSNMNNTDINTSPDNMNNQNTNTPPVNTTPGTPSPNQNQNVQGGTQYPRVSNLRPFSLEANYMSLPGFLRYLVYARDGVWLSREESVAIVDRQIAAGE